MTYFRLDLEMKYDIGCANVLRNLPEERFESFEETLDHLRSELFSGKRSPHFRSGSTKEKQNFLFISLDS